jgi:hypothetical protein
MCIEGAFEVNVIKAGACYTSAAAWFAAARSFDALLVALLNR